MKGNPLLAGNISLHSVASAAALATLLVSGDVNALGLGRLNVRSALGETLKAEIDISSLSPDEESGLQFKVASPETYRAAGVDYNSALPSTVVSLHRHSDGRPYLKITSDRAIQEPFVDLILELSWSTGRLVREYTLLFDPPASPNNMAPTMPPVATEAPVLNNGARPERGNGVPDTGVSPPTVRSGEGRVATNGAKGGNRKLTPTAPDTAKPEAPAADAANGANNTHNADLTVQRGDSLSRIANRNRQEGVSLDQMLVGLYRANPNAFVDGNMNRLRSGVVLHMPAQEQLTSVSQSEARKVIQAQSADFNSYRQRLASAAASKPVDQPERKASGQVQAEVQDQKQAIAAAPDKLTLSKGGVAASKASAVEDRLARERAQKDADARVAELSKNVEELKKLQGAASVPAAASSPSSTVASEVTSAAVGMAASAVAAASDAASNAQAASESAPTVVIQEAASEVPPPPQPAVPAPPPAAEEEPGFLASLTDNPFVLPGLGGLIVAALGGLAFYKFRSKKKPDSGETSFLESRLQPDSFFGASGGQRIDTRDAATSGMSSSMSYSLSQLDAIGDVDPVAEADVYLAYGRDLQAEEILKEAMRTTPERLAIRTKLLEVYAKRRDTKGYEQLATQLYALTDGRGEDWSKAQELGLSIDPENPLYASGGHPPNMKPGDKTKLAEALGATTVPLSTVSGDSALADNLTEADFGIDLDISSPATFDEAPIAAKAFASESHPSLSLDLPDPLVAADNKSTFTDNDLEFDLSGIDLDAPASAKPQMASAADLPDLDLGEIEPLELDDEDPLARKIELAEEFRQIGDLEGARDLLHEVIAKSNGAVQARAQSMLDSLG